MNKFLGKLGARPLTNTVTRASAKTQADAAVLQSNARADKDGMPSHLVEVVNKIISELTDMFKDSIAGLFRSGKEGEEDDEVEATDDDKDDEEKEKTEGRAKKSNGVARKKKKKIHKLIDLIKLLILGAVLAVKLGLLLKVFAAHMQIKFFLVALAGLVLNAARFYLDLKKKHDPQKVIYYEHAQHQHHYDGGDEDWSSSPGGGYWGRSYEEDENKKSAQDIAYAKQKPQGTTYSRVDNTPNFSWLG